MTAEDNRFLVDCITTELVSIVMEYDNKDMQSALDSVINSKTYELLQDPTTALSWQSPFYVYQVYKQVG